jgi:hypothetical protein
VGENPGLLRRAIIGGLVGMLLLAPNAGGVPGDPTPPEVSPTITGTLGSNGWYRSNVTVNWTIVDPESIILGTDCVLATTLTVDTAGHKLTCRALSDGGETTKSVTIKLDKSAPSAAAVPVRPPDANGWYNRPLAVSFSGADPMSGLDNCSSAQYAGPDNVAAALVGSCRDNAGNVTGASFPFRYDATAPTIFEVTAKRGNRSAELAWRKSSDTQLVQVLRAPGRGGAAESIVYPGGSADGFRDTGLVPGRKYEYRVAGVDDAANRAEQKVDFIATGALLSPAPAESVTSPPELVWTPVKGASYYNVQLIRGGKVFSAWPTRPGLRLRRTWIHNGRRHRLRPGVYRWYVWPGYGRIKAARYGKLLGSSTFVVAG